jgi:NAD(P)-dependent dehydrogenase (short-subunit alcohol dehydrogenase family)
MHMESGKRHVEQWFDGKVALVTGGADGIGRASALLFAQRGAKVAVTDIQREAGGETVALIKSQGGEACFIHGDVSSATAVRAIVQETVQRYGRLDCALNNAGIVNPLDGSWDEDTFDRIVSVNVRGVMLCLKYEIPELLKAGGGAIVNTASINAFVASASVPMPAYTSSKHAVIGLTKAAALQHARSNIRVNAICPGVTFTNMVKDVWNYSEEARRTLENFAPMGRMAQPEEMAEAAIWLCSDKSSYVTGHALVIDGGFLAG